MRLHTSAIVGVSFGISILKRGLGVADTWLLTIGMLSITGAWVVLALTTQTWMMYLMAAVSCFQVRA